MRANKYAVDLDNGATVTISGCASERQARQVAERAIRNGTGMRKYEGATSVTGVHLIERGRWG
jgi:hypothetical protein